ncbi:hypothetical protein HG530_009270 [Fusarium avenaceum]|nr:hypothetical protein HG530_009270 [Fusarium avenaceum]
MRAIRIQPTQASPSPLPQLPLPVRSNSKPLLRHHEDIRCIVTTGLFFTVFVVTWLNFSSPFTGGLLSFTLWLSLFQLSFMGAVTTHNAIHLPVFWGKNWNKFYQVCLSLQYGGAVSIFVPGHNLSHHKYPQQAKDVMRTTKVRYSWNLLNGLLFFWHVVLSGNKDDKLYFAAQARLNRPIVKQRQLEEVAVWGTTAVLILIDWRRWIWFALLPQFYAKYCILSLNFLQHDGCDMSSKYNFARNFTGKTLNYLCFNNGYHTVHHLHSGLHWSVLPEKHDELIGPQIAPSLEDSNILIYMWRTFIYPGLRLDYKGNRLIITKEEYEMPDEPWFYNEAETFSTTKDLVEDSVASSASRGHLVWDKVAGTLENILLISSELGSEGGRIISQLPINITPVSLNEVRLIGQANGVQVGSSAVGNLITLSLDHLMWGRRRWVTAGTTATTAPGSGATKELSEVILSVLNTIADAVVGVGKHRIEEVALAGELAGVHNWSTKDCPGGGENDEKLDELSHFQGVKMFCDS